MTATRVTMEMVCVMQFNVLVQVDVTLLRGILRMMQEKKTKYLHAIQESRTIIKFIRLMYL